MGVELARQLGDGTVTSRATPQRVPGLAGVVAIAAGYEHSLALRSDGTVWGWGSNFSGQLGDSSAVSQRTALGLVAGLGPATAIAAVGLGALRWGLEAGVAYLEASEIARAARLGAATEHGAGRLLLRGISPGDADAAIKSAKMAGQVLTKMGKYGTPQKHYIGTNGITVVVEQGGRNAGKIVTAFRTGMP